jgi:hypothetical protein
MKLRTMVFLCAALALTVGVSTATAGGGNSANAKLCQKGGWRLLVRSDGSSFANEAGCVSYGAAGGTLTAKTKSQLDCEALGGTFGPGPNLIIFFTFTTVYWVCNGWDGGTFDEFYAKTQIISADCFDDFPAPNPPFTGFVAEQHADTGSIAYATCGIE